MPIRKRSEERLRLQERVLTTIANGAVITDATQPGNPIIFVNPAYQKITGYAEAEVLGRNPRCVQGPDTGGTELDKVRHCVRSGIQCRTVLKNYRKDGIPFWSELTIIPCEMSKRD